MVFAGLLKMVTMNDYVVGGDGDDLLKEGVMMIVH